MRRLLLWRLSGLRTILWRLWGVWSGLCRLPWLCLSRLCHDRGFGSSLLRPWPWVLERRGLLRLDARLLGMESSPQILAPRLLRDSSQTVLRRETVISVERRGRVLRTPNDVVILSKKSL